MGLTENIVYVRPLGGVHKRAPGELLATASGRKKNNPKAVNKVKLSLQLCERESSLSKLRISSIPPNSRVADYASCPEKLTEVNADRLA